MKKVGLYLRVSTEEQVENYSIPMQKERLINFCKAKDWHIFDIYVDGGYSGSNLDRPGIQKLIADIHKLDLVLVYKLDRLSRSQKDTLYLIEDLFLANDVDFVSMNESFDTSTPFGRAMIGILSVFAQLERETIRERTITGRLERAREGLYHGGSRAPIGYDYIDGKLVIDEYEAMQVRMVFDYYLQGNGIDRVLQAMEQTGYRHKYGAWDNLPTIRNILNNPTYAGYIKFKKEVFEGQHEALVSREVFQKAQAMIKQRAAGKTQVYKHSTILSGLIYCGHCGARYFSRMNRNRRYFACYSRVGLRQMVKDPNCKNKTWRHDALTEYVEQQLFELLMMDPAKLKAPAPKKPKPKVSKKRINDIDAQISRMMDLYQAGNIPVEQISTRIEKLYDEKKALKSEPIEDAGSEVDIEHIRNIVKGLPTLWKHATDDEKRNIMCSLIKRIVINGDKLEDIKIEWSWL